MRDTREQERVKERKRESGEGKANTYERMCACTLGRGKKGEAERERDEREGDLEVTAILVDDRLEPGDAGLVVGDLRLLQRHSLQEQRNSCERPMGRFGHLKCG